MAEKPKSFTDRLREREDEEEAESQRQSEDRDLASIRRGGVPEKGGPVSGEKLDELLERIEPLLVQVHQLYNQYFSGAERLPPVERRKQLEQAMQMLHLLPKPTAAVRFKCSTLQTRYMSFVEQWDRKLRQR